MLFETFETEISPIFASVLFGALLGLLFGAAAQVSRFCLRRGLVGGRVERSAALGVWLTALLAAIIGTQAIAGLGFVDFSDHRFASPAPFEGAFPATAGSCGVALQDSRLQTDL